MKKNHLNLHAVGIWNFELSNLNNQNWFWSLLLRSKVVHLKFQIPTAWKLKWFFFIFYFLRVHFFNPIGIEIARKKSSVIWARIPRLKISPRSRRSFCGGSSYFLILCIFVIKSILTRQYNQDGPLIATLFRHQTGAEFSNNAASAKNRPFIHEISSLTHL